ncbi:hypothetical protein [Vibrio gangliei]|uniref:hypothetical protein n=1 Tax=Vibrio gangliei TaxID=2077090 RepID=UPI000D01F07B|nr:hypothetical protein [Vibrio gangliei]
MFSPNIQIKIILSTVGTVRSALYVKDTKTIGLLNLTEETAKKIVGTVDEIVKSGDLSQLLTNSIIKKISIFS